MSALVCRLSTWTDRQFLSSLATVGPLLQFEGLLSCYGAEAARIEDMAVAVEQLASVEFILEEKTAQNFQVQIKVIMKYIEILGNILNRSLKFNKEK